MQQNSMHVTPRAGRATQMDGGRTAGVKRHTMKQSFLSKRRKKLRDSSHGSANE